jgi:hypothetical protein
MSRINAKNEEGIATEARRHGGGEKCIRGTTRVVRGRRWACAIGAAWGRCLPAFWLAQAGVPVLLRKFSSLLRARPSVLRAGRGNPSKLRVNLSGGAGRGIFEGGPEWRNWQTQQTQNLPELCSVWVRLPPPGPIFRPLCHSPLRVRPERPEGLRVSFLAHVCDKIDSKPAPFENRTQRVRHSPRWQNDLPP